MVSGGTLSIFRALVAEKSQFTGRTNGPFEIWTWTHYTNTPLLTIAGADQEFVNAFNSRMKELWNNKSREDAPSGESQTNRMISFETNQTAFEISVNGEKLFTAGGDSYQTLITSLTLVHTAYPNTSDYSLIFNTSGITPTPFAMAFWPERDVRTGDRIEIRVVQTPSIDQPSRVETQKTLGGEP